MQQFSQQIIDKICSEVKSTKGVLNKTSFDNLKQQFACSTEELLTSLLPIAAQFSIAPVSDFNVGVVAYNQESGKAYFGANLEFDRQALSLVVHAEQAAINTAWLNGETRLTHMAITDAPCGHCRQFISELAQAESIKIMLPDGNTHLNELLPKAFGPADLGNEKRLLDPASDSVVKFSQPISEMLEAHFARAYAPYSKNSAAVELVTKSNGSFYGRYAENVAYNPSLSPLQSALSQLAMAGYTLDQVEVEKVILVQTNNKDNQLGVSEAVLASYDNNIELLKVYAS